ncbi:MAG: hypothetical protein GC178_18390 [Flavobacteriales bacterium]|nr:hypothetical protein [Flavobacteriales bacterium]
MGFNLKKENLTVTALGLALWGLYAFATAFPDSLWGLHHLAFLSPVAKASYLSLSFMLVLSGLFDLPSFQFKNRWRWLAVVTVPILCGLAYYHFPFAASLTGDAELFNQKMGERTTEFYPLFVEKLLSPNIFHPKTGNTTVLSGIRLMSYYFGITHHEAYRWLGAASGVLFIFLWFLLLMGLELNGSKFMVASIIGVFAPFSQFFFGYEEIYAPTYPVLLAFLITHVISFRKPSIGWLLVQLFLAFLCMKFHAVFVLLFPSVLLSTVFVISKKLNRPTAWFTWRKISLFVLLPITIAGLFVYFFITKDYNDPGFLGDDVNIYERLFLPIVSPPAPLDRYNLFSFNHALDYFNMLFQWLGGSMLVLLAVFIVLRKNVRWNWPELVSVGLASILFLMIYFAYNPLMSMPYDYDLFSIVGPVFLVFIVLVLKNDTSKQSMNWIGPTLGICLLALPMFQVNASASALSFRLENVGEHVFRTYWIRSAGDIRSAIELSVHPQERFQRFESVIDHLEPYATKGNDTEYAHLLLELGKLYRQPKGDYQSALACHQKAKEYDADFLANYIGLMECNYMLGRYREAFNYSMVLVQHNFPSEQQALRIAIECSYQAQELGLTEELCKRFLSKWNDSDIREHLVYLSERN